TLTTITDPRKYTETIAYAEGYFPSQPWGGDQPCLAVTQLFHANGTSTHFMSSWVNYPAQTTVPQVWAMFVTERLTSATNTPNAYMQFMVEYHGTPYGGAITNVPTMTTAVYSMSPNESFYYPSFYLKNESEKTYHVFSQDLLRTYDVWSTRSTQGGGSAGQYMDPYNNNVGVFDGVENAIFETRTDTSYNFAGNALSQIAYAAKAVNWGTPVTKSSTTQYSYWGQDKYWQKKAVKDHAGRVSFTDYYDENAAAGKKGQTKEIYDERYSNWAGDGSTWRYSIVPEFSTGYTSIPTAKFDYDAKGRCVWTDKLRSVAGTGAGQVGTYIRTATTYGSDTDGSWGQPRVVVEDVGGLARTTQTLEYNAQGRATQVRDARNNIFTTYYKPDGETSAISGPGGTEANPTIAKYEYGVKPSFFDADDPSNQAAWAAYGQLEKLTDKLSKIEHTFTFGTSLGEKGQLVRVTEEDPTDSSGGWQNVSRSKYTIDYTYWDTGDRRTSSVSVPGGTPTVWQYDNYVPVGSPGKQSRVYRTLRLLTPSEAKTPEELHYEYDARGRLTGAAFAQTPASLSGGGTYVPSGSAPYYDLGHKPSARAVVYYVRDVAGRVENQKTFWEQRSASGVVGSEKITEESATYETQGHPEWKGLKRTAYLEVLEQQSNGLKEYETRSDQFEYESDRGYLTAWSSTDQVSKSWSYDAAGNRNLGTYDSLNRMSAYGSSISYGFDDAGNRTSRSQSGTTVNYAWDPLNRMTLVDHPTGYDSIYQYRADGLRAAQLRWAGSGTQRVTSYRYDGGMPVEEVYQVGSSVETTRWTVGPRGTERQELLAANQTDVSYPLYDIHGNAFAHVRRDPNSFGAYLPLTESDVRSYDPWGNITTSGTGGGFMGGEPGRPTQAYCASLGHRKDDETGLIYMRARYYDPQNGRFVSEDPVRSGYNWSTYCDNDPVNATDPKGLFTLGDEVEASLGSQALEGGEGSAAAAAYSAMKGKLAIAINNYSWQIMSYLAGASGYTIKIVRNGIEIMDEADSLKKVFIDLTDKFKHGGPHIDFQWQASNGTWHDAADMGRLLLEGIERLSQVK
ncbi:MAG: RHS repeat-associated core domain-containing protein, partial [Alphaproteobacteria bacterium]